MVLWYAHYFFFFDFKGFSFCLIFASISPTYKLDRNKALNFHRFASILISIKCFLVLVGMVLEMATRLRRKREHEASVGSTASSVS